MKKFRKILMIVVGGLLLVPVMTTCAESKEIQIAIIDSGSMQYVDESRTFTNLPAELDFINHGSLVARLIRERNPKAKIHMLQVCHKVGRKFKPSKEAIKKAIEWSIQNRMDVVNLSLVMSYDKDIDDLITRGYEEHGIIFIAAGGNKKHESKFLSGSPNYLYARETVKNCAFPAAHPYVISVGARPKGVRRNDFSINLFDVTANGKAFGKDGSSMACARVTGVLSRILAKYPKGTKSQVLARLRNFK